MSKKYARSWLQQQKVFAWEAKLVRVRGKSFPLHEMGFSYGLSCSINFSKTSSSSSLLVVLAISIHENFSQRATSKFLMGCDWRSCRVSSLPCYHFNHSTIYISASVSSHPLPSPHTPAIHVYISDETFSFSFLLKCSCWCLVAVVLEIWFSRAGNLIVLHWRMCHVLFACQGNNRSNVNSLKEGSSRMWIFYFAFEFLSLRLKCYARRSKSCFNFSPTPPRDRQ